MLNFYLSGTYEELAENLEEIWPGMTPVMQSLDGGFRHYPKKVSPCKEMLLHEAMLVYVLAQQYNFPGAQFFEMGTAYGWSAATMATAAPLAFINTCTPNPSHVECSRHNLMNYSVYVHKAKSIDLLAAYDGTELDMIMVDGDHKGVRADFPWWNFLKVGGLMLFHDYNPPGSYLRPCKWVWNALNDFSRIIHQPDVQIIDHHGESMVGFYRREGEVWPK